MRIVKEAQERRNEILDVAERLFCTNGYDQTSTNDILKEIGIARGTLYYHFKSKEDILDSMIERMTSEVIAKASIIAKDKTIPVLERVVATLGALHVEGEVGDMLIEEMHRPQNALLHQKMQVNFSKNVNPLFEDMLQDAINQGIMHTDYPKQAVDMIMLYANMAFDDLMEDAYSVEKRLGFIYNTERILGMKQGELLSVMGPMISK